MKMNFGLIRCFEENPKLQRLINRCSITFKKNIASWVKNIELNDWVF